MVCVSLGCSPESGQGRGLARMPVGGLLEGVCRVQQRGLLPVVADQLQAHGQALFAKACGHAHAGQAGQRSGQREDVGQVLLHRVGRRADGARHRG